MKFLIGILSIFLAGCSYDHIQSTPQADAADEVQRHFINDVTKDKNFSVFGIGGGVHEKINNLTISFYYKKVISLEEARVLFISLNENFLYRINSALKVYLHNYPATTNEFSIDIIITDKNSNYPPIGMVSSILTGKGIIIYSSPNPKGELGLVTIYKEPYEEALRIVREQHPEVLPPDEF